LIKMPIPKPAKREKRDAFVERCMHKLKSEKRPRRQKIAICFSNWRKK